LIAQRTFPSKKQQERKEMSKFAGTEESQPKTLRELIQKKFLDEVVGCAGMK
jgi:hypothetical protein